MTHTFLIYTQWAGRIVAGVVSAVAFYFAFFLYEDEEGVWQNRIDDLWVIIDERARVTLSRSGALINGFGIILDRIFNKMFGKRLLSFRAIMISLNLSFASATIAFGVVYALQGWIESPVWLSFMGFLVPAVLLISSAVRMMKSGVFTVVLEGSIVVVGLIVLIFLASFVYPTSGSLSEGIGFGIAIAISTFSDFLVVVAVRKSFAAMVTSVSILRLIALLSLLLLLPAVLEGLPALVFYLRRDTVGPFDFSITILSVL
jgi:hypothetical protein